MFSRGTGVKFIGFVGLLPGVAERVNAGFTFEAFNLTNRTNYDEITITGDRSSLNFLIPLGAKPMRTLQLGFRLGF
ncbi:MAG: hypothetical protein LC803_19370 [Acidobacteria bacterium]|nr:hypothetical protein [Acidobacteriota bacterium]